MPKLDPEYAELRAKLAAIGATKASERDVIDAAIRSGKFGDLEISRLTGRDRAGIWKRRKTIEGQTDQGES